VDRIAILIAQKDPGITGCASNSGKYLQVNSSRPRQRLGETLHKKGWQMNSTEDALQS